MHSMDEVIEQIKPFGTYQKVMYFLIALTSVPFGLHTMSTVFVLATPDHRCAIPGLENDTYASQGVWHDELLDMTIPYDKDEGRWSQCRYYTHRNLTYPSHISNGTSKCTRWVYSTEIYEKTVISELNLVCDDKSKVTMANSIFMGGLLGGSLIMGSLADVIGRKKTMTIGLMGQFLVTFIAGFVTNFAVFVTLRFLTTFFGIGFYLAAYVAGMELVGPDQRIIAGNIISLFWTLGLFLLLVLAYFLRNWHYLQISVSCVNLLFIPYFCLIPESARWLMSRGRTEEASAIIRRAAKMNKADVPEKVLSLRDLQSDGPQEKIWHLFSSSRVLIRSLIIFFNWAVCSMVYYGLGLNVGSLSGDLFLNFLYASIAEALAGVFCLFLLFRVGRRPLHCFSMFLAGGACTAVIFPVLFGTDDDQWAATALSMIGKFGNTAAFSIMYIFSAELFPTVMRNSAMGVSSVCARFGAIASPYIATLGQFVSGQFGTALPSLMFGGLSVLAGVFALFLPETRNQKLPETIEDAKHFGRASESKKNTYALENIPSPTGKRGKEESYRRY